MRYDIHSHEELQELSEDIAEGDRVVLHLEDREIRAIVEANDRVNGAVEEG